MPDGSSPRIQLNDPTQQVSRLCGMRSQQWSSARGRSLHHQPMGWLLFVLLSAAGVTFPAEAPPRNNWPCTGCRATGTASMQTADLRCLRPDACTRLAFPVEQEIVSKHYYSTEHTMAPLHTSLTPSHVEGCVIQGMTSCLVRPNRHAWQRYI